MSNTDEQIRVEEEEEIVSIDELSLGDGDTVDEELEKELQDSLTPEEDDVPEKFKGKNINDVVKSYTELEKEFGRRNNEVGELRKLTDELLNLQLTEKEKAAEPEFEVDVDSLLENPNETINRAVENHPKFRQLEKDNVAKAKDVFVGKHPDYSDIISSGEFTSWIQESPVRLKMFQTAHQGYDYDVADELFTTYKAIRGVANQSDETEKADRASKALKEGAVVKSSGSTSRKKVYRRADLINLKMSDPKKYKAMESEIMKAYTEKRVR